MIANIYKGEVDLPNGLKCVLNFRAMGVFETLTGENAIEFVIAANLGFRVAKDDAGNIIFGEDGKPKFAPFIPNVNHYIALMQASLVQHHPDLATPEHAALLLDEYGVTFVQKVLGIAAPDQDQKPKKAAAPRKQARKTTKTD